MTTEVKTWTPTDQHKFLMEMVAVIEGTHWTKNVLACVNFLYEKDERGKTKYEKIKVSTERIVQIPVLKLDENNKPITKPTACLVGVILVVQKGGWDSVDLPEITDEHVDRWREMHLTESVDSKWAVAETLYDDEDEDDEDLIGPAWRMSETQLSPFAHSIIRLLLTELIRLPKFYRMDSDEGDDNYNFNRAMNALGKGDYQIYADIYAGIYAEVERWNDSYYTSKALARRLCLNTAKQLKKEM